MDVVKVLAHRLETQSLYEQLATASMRAPLSPLLQVPESRDIFTPPELLDDQSDDHDSGTGSDEDINSSSATAATATDMTIVSSPAVQPDLAPTTTNTSLLHSNHTGLTTQQTVMTSFYRVTSSSTSRPLEPSGVKSFSAPSSSRNCDVTSSFRPVSLVSVVPGSVTSDLHYWWSELILPRDFPVVGGHPCCASSMCSDDQCSTGSTMSCGCGRHSCSSSSEGEVDSASLTSHPATTRLLRKRRGCSRGATSSAASVRPAAGAVSDVDQEIQNILQDGTSAVTQRSDVSCDVSRLVAAAAAATGCCQMTSSRCWSQLKRLRQAPDTQRPSLNLYKMQKLRIDHKSLRRRKMSLLHHAASTRRPRPLAMSNQLSVGSPCLSKCLLPAAAGARAPAYYFRSLSNMRSTVHRLPSTV